VKKRTISILLCLGLLLGIIGSSGLSAVSAVTQAEVAGTAVSGWGAHSYVASDGETVVTTDLTANADGSVTVSGSHVANGLGIGVTNTAPVYLDQSGFSIEFSFDKWDTNSGEAWYALYLSNRKTATNNENTDPVFKGWDNDGTMDAAGEQGMVLIMRPKGNGRLVFQWFYHGVTSNTDATPATKDLVYLGDGCYDDIILDSGNYENIKLDFIRRADYGDTNGGYGIIFNDGAYARTSGGRIDAVGEVSPQQSMKLLDQIFPTGTPMYVKLVSCNSQNAETALTVHKFNGEYANTANTLDSWGVHNYVTPEGSTLTSSISATDNGDIVVSGNQTAGNGELGVTYARPVDMTEGFSIEFSLDEYNLDGVDGADTWIALQIKDKMTVTDGTNADPVYHKMDIGGGNPAYGSGWHVLIRPKADNVLNIGQIYYCGLSTGGVPETVWRGDANGCYSQIKLDSFDHIKLSFIPNGNGGYYITFNDGDFEPVGNSNPNPGYINLANSYPLLNQYFKDKPAYVSLSYKCNKGDQAQFTVHSFNGEQAAPNTMDSWGIHDFIALDGSHVVTNAAADQDGGLVLSGNQTAGHGAIGATYKRPVDISEGVSVEFSLDEYNLNGVSGVDSWFAVQLLRSDIITDSWNSNGAYRHFEVGKSVYGDGLVMLIRPLENNQLGIGEIYINGAAVDGTIVEGAFNGVTNGGCYSKIQVDSFQNIKIDIVPSETGSFHIIFNDGDYIRVGADRMKNDHGKINVNESFSWLKDFFSDEHPAYLKLAYKCSAGTPAQFTINKVNGINAVPPAEESPEIPVTDGIYELLKDTKYENGFMVRNMGGAEKNDPTVGYLNYGNAALIPSWSLAQWETKYDFRDLDNDTFFMELDDGVYEYDSLDKIFTVDTNTGTLGMELNASEVYDDPRQSGEGWPHLLIAGDTKNAEAPFANQAKNLNHLRLTLSAKLTKYEDCMGDEADTSLHAAAFYIYLYVKGVNEAGKSEMTWFGLTIFDNRYAFHTESGQVDGGKADASGLYIYQVPSRAFTDTNFLKDNVIHADEDNEWMTIDIDVLPYIERALVRAQKDGFMKGVTMDTVYIDGMNMGWEMPGTYDAKMEVKDLSLRSYVGTTYELNNGIYNIPVADAEENTTIAVDEKLTLNVPKHLIDMDGIDESMLIIQSSKRDTTEGITIEGFDVQEAYDLGVWVNGINQTTKFDNNMKVVYDAGEGDVTELSFYAIGTSGNARELEGTYDENANTFTVILDRASVLAIVTEAEESEGPENPGENPENPGENPEKPGDSDDSENPETGDMGISAAVIMLLTAAVSVCALVPKKRKF